MPKPWVAVLIGLMFSNQGLADTIVLKNGDRLTGTIIGKVDGKLMVKTAYAGKIGIAWAEVQELSTEAPVHVILSDETSMRARLLPSKAGTVRLQTSELIRTEPIPLDKVTYLNPPPHVSGQGVEFSGHAKLGINVSQGNTDTQNLYLEGEAVARTKTNRYTLGGTAREAKEDGHDTASNATLYMKYDHFLSKHWYLYGSGTFTRDDFRDLNLRSTIGAGSGYQVWDTKARSLSLEAGLAYVNEDFMTAADDHYAALRWAVDYDQLLFNGWTELFHDHEGVLGLEDTEDIIVRSRTGLRIPLAGNLDSSLQVNADWDNSPPAGTDSTDLTYLLNLGYRW